MGKLLFIDSDDINGLSEALRNALSRRGINFGNDTTGEFDYPHCDDEEPDFDPYLGITPKPTRKKNYDEDDRWLFQESGGSYGSCGGSGCGGGSCGCRRPSYGGCGGGYAPRC